MNEPLSEAALSVDDPDLFGHFSLVLPTDNPRYTFARLLARAGKPQLVWSRDAEQAEGARQFELLLADPSDRRVVQFVCARRRHYLNYSLRDLCRRSPALHNAVRLLTRRGIHFVGDLMAREHGYLTHVVGLDTAEVRAFDELLSRAQLRTNMLVPNWAPPFSRTA